MSFSQDKLFPTLFSVCHFKVVIPIYCVQAYIAISQKLGGEGEGEYITPTFYLLSIQTRTRTHSQPHGLVRVKTVKISSSLWPSVIRALITFLLGNEVTDLTCTCVHGVTIQQCHYYLVRQMCGKG